MTIRTAAERPVAQPVATRDPDEPTFDSICWDDPGDSVEVSNCVAAGASVTGAPVIGADVIGAVVTGVPVGKADSATDGVADATNDGIAEGDLDGESDGSGLVGNPDGDTDGAVVGETETDGSADTSCVGKDVGRADGDPVLGVVVGNSVGAGVGKRVTPSSSALTLPSVSLKYNINPLLLRANSASTLDVHGVESSSQPIPQIMVPSDELCAITTPSS